MTAEGSFRLIAVSLRSTVREIAAAQEASGPASEQLAELVAASILLRETSAPDKRVQLTMTPCDGPSLFAESRPDGACRGIVNPPTDSDLTFTLFQVAYHRKDGSLHQSTVEVDSNATIAESLMRYLQESSQIVATVDVQADTSEAGALTSTAYSVQLLPHDGLSLESHANADVVETITSRLEQRTPLQGHPDVDAVLSSIVGAIDTTPLSRSELRFECTCSRERILATLSTLGQDDVASMVAAQEALEIRCDGCTRVYEIQVSELSELLVPAQT